jgi:hypothetical protein
MRTTIDIDTPILRELKRIQKEEGKSLGRLVSELLTEAMGRRKTSRQKPPPFTWNRTRGQLLVDLADKDAVYEILDADATKVGRR